MSQDTQYQNEVICPHCGYVHRDSWEIDFGGYGDGEITMECANCDEPMVVTRQVEVTYSTEPVKKETPP